MHSHFHFHFKEKNSQAASSGGNISFLCYHPYPITIIITISGVGRCDNNVKEHNFLIYYSFCTAGYRWFLWENHY